MSARIHTAVSSEHRAEASHDRRTGTIYVRVRRHKRGKPLSFTLDQWLEFEQAIKDGAVAELVRKAALARVREAGQ